MNRKLGINETEIITHVCSTVCAALMAVNMARTIFHYQSLRFIARQTLILPHDQKSCLVFWLVLTTIQSNEYFDLILDTFFRIFLAQVYLLAYSWHLSYQWHNVWCILCHIVLANGVPRLVHPLTNQGHDFQLTKKVEYLVESDVEFQIQLLLLEFWPHQDTTRAFLVSKKDHKHVADMQDEHHFYEASIRSQCDHCQGCHSIPQLCWIHPFQGSLY